MAQPEPGRKVVLYARFSPRTKAQECQSAEKQLERLREWAGQGNYEVKGEFADEAVSGALTDDNNLPPQLGEAVTELERGDHIVAINVSRFSRDGALLAFLDKAVKRRGAHIYVLDERLTLDDYHQSFLFKILCLFYEMDRERQRDLCRAAQRKKARRGEIHPGQLRYGYTPVKKNGKWQAEINEKEYATLQRMLELREAGWKQHDIAEQLNKEGHTKRNGKPWKYWSVSDLLIKNEDPGGWPYKSFTGSQLGPEGSQESFGSDWDEGIPDVRDPE